MLIIENGTVYTPLRSIADGAVLVKDGRIEAVGRRGRLAVPKSVQRLDAHGGTITPGFINMHIHGAGGYSAMDGQAASYHAMSLLVSRHGVTSYVPTTASATLDVIEQALRAARQARHEGTPGAEILGIHV